MSHIWSHLRRVAGRLPAVMTLFLVACAPFLAAAQDGALDPSFGDQGVAMQQLGEGDAFGYSVARDSGGRIVAAAWCTIDDPTHSDGRAIAFCATRYEANGTVDLSFGIDGTAIVEIGTGDGTAGPNAFVMHVALQTDDSVILSSECVGDTPDSGICMSRLLASGALDLLFGQGGSVFLRYQNASADWPKMSTDSEGRILLGGSCFPLTGSGACVARYLPDGTFDPTFNGGAMVFITRFASFGLIDITTGPDDRTYMQTACYSGVCLVRLAADGSIDETYGAAIGASINSDAGAGAAVIALDARGRLLIGGVTTEEDIPNNAYIMYATVARYDDSGQPDASFGNGGVGKIEVASIDLAGAEGAPWAHSVAIDNEGRLVISGTNEIWSGPSDVTSGWLVRFSADGLADTSFGTDGVVSVELAGFPSANIYLEGITLDSGNRIIATGSCVGCGTDRAERFVARYQVENIFSATFE